MIRDVLTVMWKEWRDMPTLRGSRAILSQAVFIGVFGIMIPSQSGPSYLSSPTSVFFAIWIPMITTVALVADTFAGERERRTLESLLASRLSDKVILLGKLGTVVAYGWGLTLSMLLLGLVTVNAANWHGKVLMYPASVGLGAPILGLLTALFMCGLGVIVSLRASTVRQAAQTLGMGFLLIPIIAIFAPMAPKPWVGSVVKWASNVGPGGIIRAVAVMLLAADVVVLRVAIARFRRSRLILD